MSDQLCGRIRNGVQNKIFRGVLNKVMQGISIFESGYVILALQKYYQDHKKAAQIASQSGVINKYFLKNDFGLFVFIFRRRNNVAVRVLDIIEVRF